MLRFAICRATWYYDFFCNPHSAHARIDPVLGKAPQQEYSRQDVRRMLDISEQQLRGWQRQGFISASENCSFSDLIALRALQKLRENHIPSTQIGRALVSLKQKLSDVSSPL